MGLSPGDRVDRYEVMELLGAGGMGEVYRARDPKLARFVALKILRTAIGTDSDGAARLLREARAAAALTHANVLAIYDVGEVHEPPALRGMSYIAMELVVGRSLRAYVGDDSIPIDTRVAWLRDVASALAAAHRAGIIHRDVKPENVMIQSGDGAVKVLDFGIARRQATFDLASTGVHSLPTGHVVVASTEAGRIVGTPYFMAPEQLRAETLDGRTDQFAWGVMAYMLVTGKGPWRGNGEGEPLAVISQILSEVPQPPRTLDAGIPPFLSDVIVRALAKERGARFASMDDLVRAIDARAPAPTPATSTESGPPPAPYVTPPTGATSLGVAAAATGSSSVRPTRWLGLTLGIAALLGALGVWRARAHKAAVAPPTVSGNVTAASGLACTSNRDCLEAHQGEAWHCRTGGQCVALDSHECKVYADPVALAASDTVWFGEMYPVTSWAKYEMRTAELARQDFATALGPSAAREGQTHARPLGLIVCDEDLDAMRAARHLAEDAEVPAVFGFLHTESALQTIPAVFLSHHVLSMVTLSQSPTLTQIPQIPGEPRLVWRATLNRAAYAEPLAHFISEVVEPASREGPESIGAHPFKVATLLEKGAHTEIADGLFDLLRFNGKTAFENGSDFRQFTCDPADEAQTNDVRKAMAEFAPNAIVYAGAGVTKVLEPLEAHWKSGPRPYYVTAEGLGSFGAFAPRDSSLRHRRFSVNVLASIPANARLVLRYDIAFPEQPITRGQSTQPSYDAFYLLAYATYALGDSPVTGTALARAMSRLLPPGKNIEVGPHDILDAFNALRFGDPHAHIDLNGALGGLDFDEATGEAPVDYAIMCSGVDDRGLASDEIDSGLVWDARARKLVGKLHCP